MTREVSTKFVSDLTVCLAHLSTSSLIVYSTYFIRHVSTWTQIFVKCLDCLAYLCEWRTILFHKTIDYSFIMRWSSYVSPINVSFPFSLDLLHHCFPKQKKKSLCKKTTLSRQQSEETSHLSSISPVLGYVTALQSYSETENIIQRFISLFNCSWRRDSLDLGSSRLLLLRLGFD